MRSSFRVLPIVLSIALSLSSALVGCESSDSAIPAEGEILLSTTGGEEEGLSSRASFGSLAPSGDPDQPPMMRECDASGTYTGIFSEYDADADEHLDEGESASVEDAHGGRDEMAARDAEMRWHLMLLIYDTDEDGSLSDAEKSPLFEDFTARCEVLSARLLEDFDADGDGELSASELATAEEAIEAEREAHRAEMEERMGERPEECGPPPEPGSRQVPPGLDAFDTDGDALLSDAELSTLRDALRERVRSGEPIVEPPPEG